MGRYRIDLDNIKAEKPAKYQFVIRLFDYFPSKPEMIKWLQENSIHDFHVCNEEISFKSEEDAILFRLAWVEEIESSNVVPRWVNGLKVRK